MLGPTQGVRWQSASHDNGTTWSPPRVLDFGFGSSCEGSIISVPGKELLLFSHPGRIGTGRQSISRWNLTVWYSLNSGADWKAFDQVERGEFNETLSIVHTAYSYVGEEEKGGDALLCVMM